MLAVSEPREGANERMPPCLRLAVFEGRVATFYDEMGCDHKDPASMPARYEVLVGQPTEWLPWAHGDHPQTVVPSVWVSGRTQYMTDDPDEAQAAFDKGAEYVRTGVMP